MAIFITLFIFPPGSLKSQDIEKHEANQAAETETLWRQDTLAQNYPDPNDITAKSRRSLIYHFFALPSTVWEFALTPLKVTLIWSDQHRLLYRVKRVLMNDAGTAGIIPIIGAGLDVPSSFGAMLFHNSLFGNGEKYNGQFKYNSIENIRARSSFKKPGILGTKALFYQIHGDYFLDEDQEFYPDGNGGDPDSSLNYNTREGGGRFIIGHGSLGSKQEFRLITSVRRYNTNAVTTLYSAADFTNANLSGIGLNTMFSIGGTIAFDFTHRGMRTNKGTYLKFYYDYHNDLNGDLYEYQRYQLMAEHYIPAPFMAKNRRFYIRALIEKQDRLNGKNVPFYELSVLGSPFNLRGFDNHRFRGRGRLLFNFEYRYPIWDNLDGVLFLDEGQVFDGFEEISPDRFHAGYGFGIRFASPTGIGTNLGFGWSKETFRFYLQVSPNTGREEP